MAIQTLGFRPTTELQYTPVDPRYAVRDPFAFSAGLNRGLADMQALQQDALQRADLPRLKMLKDIELAQAQAEMASLPAQKRLKDLQIANAERQLKQSMFEPVQVGKPIRELDENGNLVEYQPLSDFNPATGTAYGPGEKPAMDVSLIKTKDQLEAEQRAMAALAQNRTNLGEAALIRATTPQKNIMKTTINAQNQVVDQWFSPDGQPVTDPTLRLDANGQPVIARSNARAGGGLSLEDIATGGAPAAPSAPTTIKGTEAPANQAPTIEFIPPERSFNSEAEVMAAAQAGLLKPGWVLVHGVRKYLAEGP